MGRQESLNGSKGWVWHRGSKTSVLMRGSSSWPLEARKSLPPRNFPFVVYVPILLKLCVLCKLVFTLRYSLKWLLCAGKRTICVRCTIPFSKKKLTMRTFPGNFTNGPAISLASGQYYRLQPSLQPPEMVCLWVAPICEIFYLLVINLKS